MRELNLFVRTKARGIPRERDTQVAMKCDVSKVQENVLKKILMQKQKMKQTVISGYVNGECLSFIGQRGRS